MRTTSPVAPWMRTRLRTAPGAAAALFLLVLLTSCLAAAFPRAVDRYEDRGVRQSLAQETPGRLAVGVTVDDPGIELTPRQRAVRVSDPVAHAAYRKIAGLLRAPLAADPRESSYGTRSVEPMTALDRRLPRIDGPLPVFTLNAQGGLADHARVTRGRLPRGHHTAHTMEAAVTRETARHLHLEPGAVVHLPGFDDRPTTVRITGVVEPRDPSGAYWSTAPLLRTPEQRSTKGMPPQRYWAAALLLAPGAATAIPDTPGRAQSYWQLAPVTDTLTARQLPDLKAALANIVDGPGLPAVRTATASETADVSSHLGDVLDRYDTLRSGVTPVVSVAAYGTGALACVVLLMAGGLGADRRRAELALLRSRGGSLPGIGGRLLAETAAVAVPAGALGLLLALLVVPYGRWTLAATAAGAVVLVACATLPLRAVAAHRRARPHGTREDLATSRPSARRTVAELTLLAMAVAAVVALRRRGATDSGDGLVALAPVLVGVVAAFVLVRLLPLPLRRLVGPVGRLRGTVGHLSLARTARSRAGAATAVLPLLALLTALTTAAFGGSVLAGVGGARDRAALATVGADARVDGGGPLSAAALSRVRHAPGVRDMATAAIDYDVPVADSTRRLALAGVDREAYARLARRTGLGAFPADALRPTGRATVPVLASPSLAGLFTGGRLDVRLNGETVTLRLAAERTTTPALVDDFVIVDAAALARATGAPARPTALLLTGDRLDAKALRGAAGADTTVRLRSTERARYVDSPVQSGATGIYVAAVAAGAGYALLALLIALAHAAPERLALLARLRTMGLTRGQARRLLVLEALPQAFLAAAGGALTGWAAIRILSPGLDLTTLALADGPSPTTPPHLHTAPLSLALPAAGVLLLALGAATFQAWWSGRRGSVRELRAGDGGVT
ncbi:FtsX-like permease family protein [Streptomyces sp. NPDC051684]|uniref:FtsX-like permease family protein n=1 Tax=Streptomyces sp. NPDC051684 TaxID=3365670 RepID=UPI00378B8369